MLASRPLIAALCLAAAACSQPAPEISVRDGWARETLPGQSAAAYLTIVNGGGPDRLLSASSPAAAAVTLHSTTRDGGVARMRPLPDGFEIEAGATVRFEPGGNHVMLTGLKQPLKAGGLIPVALRFQRSGERSIEIQVRPAGAGEPIMEGH